MTYTKPELKGFSAVAVVQTSGANAKSIGGFDAPGVHSQPAYEADE